ncbi:porin [Paraburkholderia sp. SIMBA_054]|uniref:porin n=1 Tax=Paraburkholderia sp. SIMBA_054 TaxID=3085795 RepID=UPI0039786037
MKAKLAVLALAGMFASIAHAQSSVTLYGVLDESLQYTNSVKSNGHAGSVLGLADGANNTMVWGIKGKEDLGGGLHAIFTLESQFGLSNGALPFSNDLFGRQSWVGLSDDRWGTVTVGKQYSPVTDYLCPVSAYCAFGGNMSAHVYDNDNVGGSYTINNSVKYQSPVIAGFHFGAMYAFSNDAGQFTNNNLLSVGAGYDNGPLHLAAAYMDATNPASGTNANGGAVGSNMYAFLPAGNHRVWGAGANVDIGKGAVGVLYTHSTYLALATSDNAFSDINGDDLRFDNYSLYGHYPLSGALSFGAGYTLTNEHLSGSTGATLHNQQVTVDADYHLSRRTTLYVEAAYQHISGGSGLSLAYANIVTAGSSATNNQAQVAAGIRQTF